MCRVINSKFQVKATCLEALLPYTRRHNPKGIAENRVVEKSLHVINSQNDGVAGGRQNRETSSGSHWKRKKVHVLLTTQILSPRIAHAGRTRPWAVHNAASSRIRKKSGISRSLPAHAAALPGAKPSTSDEHRRSETNDNPNRGKIFYTKMVMSDGRQLKPLTSFSFVVGSRHNFNIPPLSENVQWWPRDLLPQTMETLQSKTPQRRGAVPFTPACSLSVDCGQKRSHNEA